MSIERPSELRGLLLACVLLAGLVTVDAAFGSEIVISASYSVAAVLAAALVSVSRTAVVGVIAVVLAVIAGVWNDNFGTLEWGIRIVLAAALASLAVLVASVRVRREQALRRMTVIAEKAQLAVLRSMPTAVDSVGLAARYISATEEAQVGGDLYEVAPSPHGVRLIVGDVRGNGLEAVHLAATVMGGFRQSAYRRQTLGEVVEDLERLVRSMAGEEDFVTAVLAEFHEDDTVTIVNCGHHPPVVVSEHDTVHAPPAVESAPPLGLSPAPIPVSCAWPPGSRLLLYTDGLVEARDRGGAFFPLDQHVSQLRQGNLEEALDRLLDAFMDHIGPRLGDDVALVVAENRRPVAAQASSEA